MSLTCPRLLRVAALLLLSSCFAHPTPRTYLGGWTEGPLAFGNSVPHVSSRGGYYELLLQSKWYGPADLGVLPGAPPLAWVRSGPHLLQLHRTLRRLGYTRFVSLADYQRPMDFDAFGDPHSHWQGQSLQQVVDSLISSGEQPAATGYYAAFWRRRAAEHNQAAVLQTLREIRAAYRQPPPTSIAPAPADTLGQLLHFDLQLQASAGKPDAALLTRYFDYLRRIGLGSSAYNLVAGAYPGLLDSSQVAQQLKLHPVPAPEYWRTVNQAVWIRSYHSEGP
jgi:hypothetical protein